MIRSHVNVVNYMRFLTSILHLNKDKRSKFTSTQLLI